MLVMILKKVPASLRGELSRWLIEPETGVFLGNPSARVRDELWQLAVRKCKGGSVLQIWSRNGPQGYVYRCAGAAPRRLKDFEGIALVRRPPKKHRSTKSKKQKPPDAPAPDRHALFDN
jgi:CRISPR-associated protein Cas2